MNPRDTALAVLAAIFSGDKDGAAEMVATFDGDDRDLSAAMVAWLQLLVADAGAPVADALLVTARGVLLRLAATS